MAKAMEKIEEENVEPENPKSHFLMIFGIILGILILVLVVLAIWQVPRTVQEQYTDSVPYQDTEYYMESVPYQTLEYYQDTVNAANCDSVYGCSCLHKSWLGLGSCDSCTCTKSREITKYQDVQKSRDITKYKDVIKYRDVTKYCSALNTIFGACD